MSSSLSTALTLALATVPPFVSIQLNRVFPAPHAGFIVVASSVAAYTTRYLDLLRLNHGIALTEKYITAKNRNDNPIFHQLPNFYTFPLQPLLPIIARVIGQRMGYPVPGYLQTVGYFSLTTPAYRFSRFLLEVGQSAWRFLRNR